MAMASWMLRGRTNRSTRFNRTTQEKSEDQVRLDYTKDPYDNTKEILLAITNKSSSISEKKHLNYLNAFVQLLTQLDKVSLLGYCTEEILCCLRISAVNETALIRSGAFRVIRYLLSTEDDIISFNKLLYPFIIVRSLDSPNKNDGERVEVMKLIRRILALSAINFDKSIARSLVSLANGGVEDKDRTLRACLAILSEIGILNYNVFITSGGVSALTRNLLECQTPKIAESICGVLLMLLDKPSTRLSAGVDLHCVAAPYCDFHYRHGWLDKNRDERELRFNCSRLALLSIFRSWPGILHFCSPNNTCGLKAIVEVLYLDQLEVRKAVLDLLYDLLDLPQPEWTDELSVALAAIDPAEPQGSWGLNEGFVAAEGRTVLPHLSRTTPNIVEQHLALLLYCFIETGLLGALCEVIATSDTFISVRATVLLGELLRLIQFLLPPECCNITPALPNLLEHAVHNIPQALHAITALQQLHKLLKRRPASYSLYLDYILQSGTSIKSSNRNERLKRHRSSSSRGKLASLVHREGGEAIKETGVAMNKDCYMWNWNQINLILMGETDVTFDMSDATHRTFFRRLIEFYLPSNNKYSHMDITTQKNTQGYTIVGLQLIDCLLKMKDAFGIKLLFELFKDISLQITPITQGKAHDCLFSPQHMLTTQCHTYFLFIGRFGATHDGMDILKSLDIYEQLKCLATTSIHDCYVKLIISSLDYKEAGPSRDLLSAVLTCERENSRLYATQFLLVLLRAGIPQFSNWGIKLLAKQLNDSSRAVHLFALNTLHEACEIPLCLETLVKLDPNVLHLGEKGVLLLIRFLSIPLGYKMLCKNNFVMNEIKRWDDYFNYKYVKLVEGDISDTLTLHQRGEDGRYDKRISSSKTITRKDLFVLPHLYGQLSKYEEGLKCLIDCGSIDRLIYIINVGACSTDDEILNLKGALWALGHLGSSSIGLNVLQSKNILGFIVALVENSPVYSIRATAFYMMGLLATTKIGADTLFKLGWVCTRHDRHDRWPIIEEENWEGLKIPDSHLYTSTCSDSERNSNEQALQGDFFIADADSSTTDEDLICAGDAPSITNEWYPRSSSESKTLDMLKLNESKSVFWRHRDNSITESTTSGVSSCDSMFGKNININDKTYTLSPIPSSSSLITIKNSGVKLRRYSESARRGGGTETSITPTDKLTISPSSSGKLSQQDRIGYAKMRLIQHRRRAYSSNEGNGDPAYFMRVNSLDRRIRHSYQFSDDYFGSYQCSYFGEPSLSSLSSVQNFSIKDTAKAKERSYMGICLPIVLNNVFPNNSLKSKRFSFYYKKYCEGETTLVHSNNEVDEEEANNFEHDASVCFKCSQPSTVNLARVAPIPENENQEDDYESIRTQVLREIEKLSNPVVMKPARQFLLHSKQKYPLIFQDICIYSDVCKMLSETSFRLGPRRFIQDLFMEVDFTAFQLQTTQILQQAKKTINNEIEIDKINNDQGAATRSNRVSSLGIEDRKQELFNKNMTHTSKSITRGFIIETSNVVDEIYEDRLSPTKFEPRSPPLTSVKEENTSSTENLLFKNIDDSNCKTDIDTTTTETNTATTKVSFPTVRTLDSLNLTCNENKFPIKNRNETTNFIK